MATGYVKRIVFDRGFGFIRDERDGQEYFFHRTAVTGSFERLTEGARVTYEPEASAKGPRANQVRER